MSSDGTAYQLIAAGGHAKVVAAALLSLGHAIACYVDPMEAAWLDAPRRADDQLDPGKPVAIGLGGVTPAQLERRQALCLAYARRGFSLPSIAHARSCCAPDVQLGDGSQVMAGAIVNPGARIGRGVIINTGAIVEHDASIGDGSHIAPGAIVLGGARVGACCMVGAGAVVLPGSAVADGALVRAQTRFPR